MADNHQHTALEWVTKEIRVTLSESQRVLELYANDAAQDAVTIRSFITLIHQVYGSLRMAGLHSAAMLAEEIEILAQALLNGEVRSRREALKVLMTGALQLPDYLERVQKTKQDYPAIVLSLLNDIRSVRGANLISESTLFAPDLDYALKVIGKPHPLTQNPTKLKMVVAKLRQLYQYSAACVIHNINLVSQSFQLLS